MSSRVQCIFLERTDLARRSLRRYASIRREDADGPNYTDVPCVPGHSFHNASVIIVEAEPFNSPWNGHGDDSQSHDDPRWPARCEHCGFEFQPEHNWQSNVHRVWRSPDGKFYTDDDAPIGALAFGMGCGPTSSQALARGLKPSFPTSERGAITDHLSVKLPDGTWWDIDGPASREYRDGGSGWTRDGEPPLVTASPSIKTSRYHGHLEAGVLVPCSDSQC